jgi:hypothetical protein
MEEPAWQPALRWIVEALSIGFEVADEHGSPLDETQRSAMFAAFAACLGHAYDLPTELVERFVCMRV